MFCECLLACVFGVVAAAAALLMDIWRMRKSDNHTCFSLISQYIIQTCLHFVGSIMFIRLQHDSKNYRKVQDGFLKKNLKKNRNTEYGKEYKFSEITTREQFVKLHPLTRYSHYLPYVEKIAAGQNNVLTSSKVVMLSVTSGTTGASNLVPTTQDVFRNFFLYGISILSYCMVTSYPQVRQLQKVLKFFYSPIKRKSAAGLPIGPNSSSPGNSRMVLPLYSTPSAGYEIMTEHEAQYIHLLFALKDRNIGAIEANFASVLHHGFVSMRFHWQQLVEDIRYGRVSPNLKIPDDLRSKLDHQLKPDPKRAKELEEEFAVGFDAIARRIWPNLNIVLTTDTGSMKLYGDILKSVFTKDVKHYSPLYTATEGLIGVNIWPTDVKSVYMLVPKSMFFEFIPIDEIDKKYPQTLFADQVRVGDSYELVVSNGSGLYRYRLGDVVKIVRFHNQTPVVEFKYRQGQIMNVRGEKMSEQVFYETLMECSSHWHGKHVLDYCCAESGLLDDVGDSAYITPAVPHYYVFLEFECGSQLSEEEALQLDHMLRVRHWVYNSFRSKGSIQAVKVLTVKRGTFQDLRQYLLASGNSSPNQIKIPRVLHKGAILQFMLDHVDI